MELHADITHKKSNTFTVDLHILCVAESLWRGGVNAYIVNKRYKLFAFLLQSKFRIQEGMLCPAVDI